MLLLLVVREIDAWTVLTPGPELDARMLLPLGPAIEERVLLPLERVNGVRILLPLGPATRECMLLPLSTETYDRISTPPSFRAVNLFPEVLDDGLNIFAANSSGGAGTTVLGGAGAEVLFICVFVGARRAKGFEIVIRRFP